MDGHSLGFRPESPEQHNKQDPRGVLLNSFHLSGHTLGFNPQTQKSEPPCTA